MINDNDRTVLLNLCLKETDKLGLKKDAIFNVQRLIYGDYFNGIDGENRPYLQIEDI
jgi:hypothetical protein